MSKPKKQIALTREQIDFVKYMTEETNASKAVEKFAMIMIEEGVDTSEASDYIDDIMAVWAKRK